MISPKILGMKRGFTIPKGSRVSPTANNVYSHIYQEIKNQEKHVTETHSNLWK